MMKRYLLMIIGVVVMLSSYSQLKQSFNKDWQFAKDIDSIFSETLLAIDSDVKWEKVSLPHTANIEPVEKSRQQWQGICYYRKFFFIPASSKGKHVAIQFDAAMHEADVYLNGLHIFKHLGGYLPFYIDVSEELKTGSENSIVVRLDNRDNPLIPPGKPLAGLDFNYYSGIYRNAWLITKDKLYISNPIAANTTAGGGVFIHYEKVTPGSATLVLKTEVNNDFTVSKKAQLRATVTDKNGKTIARSISPLQNIISKKPFSFNQSIIISNPSLWSPENPYLYRLTVEVFQDGKLVDKEIIKTGIKLVRLERNAFFLNDHKIKIRGTNRHQDYPYIGNAVSDNAQYRDAYKIKQAGFNLVRTSHYPQSTAFLEACDELGLMVIDAIPGWQFVGNEVFQQNSFRDIREMIRRDRNHPSIVLWEASLNESGMRREYMEKAHNIVHEELPFPGIYSAGWRNTVFDVFLPARQHGKAPDYWKRYDKEMPLLIAEYGDWEYYAQNAGFNQTSYKDLKPEERSSRQLRGFGEKRLLQQALNYQEAHNDNLYGADLGDANWLMFDYNRGYADDIESSGIMDIFRLPKFSFYFYQSQTDPVINGNAFNKPMLHIANYWQKSSEAVVKVYGNCEEVELFLNGKSLGRQQPDKDNYSVNLRHPPFTFRVPSFAPGTLSAAGYLNNKKIIGHERRTPGTPAKIRLRVDHSGRDLKSGQNDIVFVYAEVVDAYGTIVYDAGDKIEFQLAGDATLVGENPRGAEAGTATILLKAGETPGKIKISAISGNLKSTELVIRSK